MRHINVQNKNVVRFPVCGLQVAGIKMIIARLRLLCAKPCFMDRCMDMDSGRFCFLADQYYEDFPDEYLMRNKEVVDGVLRDRPCFFVFQDSVTSEILWLVPISSNYAKYKALYDKKVERYKKCNTIRFGEVLGKQAAFLIQNMCPVTKEYIREVYVDKNGVEIQVDGRIAQDVIANAREVLAITKRGAKIVFPDVNAIHKALREQIAQHKKQFNSDDEAKTE